MTVHVSTNAHDPMPWVSTECLGWDPDERSVAQRFYLDRVVSSDPRRELRVQVPVAPEVPIPEDRILELALTSARREADDSTVVGLRWLPPEEIAVALRERGLRVVEVTLLGTPRA